MTRCLGQQPDPPKQTRSSPKSAFSPAHPISLTPALRSSTNCGAHRDIVWKLSVGRLLVQAWPSDSTRSALGPNCPTRTASGAHDSTLTLALRSRFRFRLLASVPQSLLYLQWNLVSCSFTAIANFNLLVSAESIVVQPHWAEFCIPHIPFGSVRPLSV